MVETKVPDLADVPLTDLAKNEDLLAALRHTLREPSRPTSTIAIGPAFSSSI